MILTLTKEQFIDALPDEDTKLRIRQLRPKNLQQALETALEMESYHLAARQRRPVREVRLERRLGKQQQKYTGAESKVLEKLQECLEVFQSCRGEKGSTGRPDKCRAGRRAQVTCWGCKQKGHFRWECPSQKQADVAETAESSQAATSPPPSGNEK